MTLDPDNCVFVALFSTTDSSLPGFCSAVSPAYPCSPIPTPLADSKPELQGTVTHYLMALTIISPVLTSSQNLSHKFLRDRGHYLVWILDPARQIRKV